jgi:transcriptional regulator with XRE-family HTH domain
MMTTTLDESEHAQYATMLGDRLRNVRQQQGLSLHDVEEASGGTLKASVVGAYERGERAISVTRLRTLAEFYKVPIAQLLPGRQPRSNDRPSGVGLRVDLTRLQSTEAPQFEVIERYLGAIQARRGDYNGRMLTVRGADVQALAAVLDQHPEELRDSLVAAGVVAGDA